MGGKLNSKIFTFDRRQFLKATGVYGVGATFLAKGVPAFGQSVPDQCKAVETNLETGEKVLNPAAKLQYFVDGLHFNDRTNINSRANVSLFIEEQQTPERYVERVVLTDMVGNTLGVQYFDAEDKMSQGFVPYVIFENIRIAYDQVYKLYYQVRKGEEVELYYSEIQNVRRSLFNGSSLPKQVVDDFKIFRGNNDGLFTTAFEFQLGVNPQLHSAKGTIRAIGAANDFSIDVELMHGDANAAHFMRYFIVADPVGRILGMQRRNLGDPVSTNVAPFGGAGAMTVTAMNDAQAVGMGIRPEDVAKINDCPYIQIYTEDVQDALARSSIRLR